MKTVSASASLTATFSRCRYRTPAGRSCRQLAHDASLGLCPKHAGPQFAVRPVGDFRKVLTTHCDEFATAIGIHNSLSELYKLLAADLITSRRAAVLAYIANLLLRTIPVVHAELDSDSGKRPVGVEVDFGDLPRPDRSHPPHISSKSNKPS
jgi:hypothetical protein